MKQAPAHEWRGACPIHQGRHLNFTVDANTGAYFCFSQCGAGGSLYDLELTLYGGTFTDARNRVWDIVGRPAPVKRTKREQRDWDAKQRRDQQDSEQAEAWRLGALQSLEWQLEFEKTCLEKGTRGAAGSFQKLTEAIRLHTQQERQIQEAGRSELLRLYREQCTKDPVFAAFLIRLGTEPLSA